MTKVFDDGAVVRAFREASEALRRGDPDTLAGRFSPRPLPPEAEPAAPARPTASVATVSPSTPSTMTMSDCF